MGEPESTLPFSGDPSWSDDGKWLRYRSRTVLSGLRDLAAMNFIERNIETGEERFVEQRKVKVSPPPWHYSESRDGGFAVFADRDGHTIHREYFATKVRDELFTTEEPVSGLLAFRDGREILFSTHSEGRDIHPIKALRLSDGHVRDIGVSRVPPQWEVSPNDDEVALGDLNCLVILHRSGGKAQELACASPARLPTPGKYPGVRVMYVWWTDLMPSWSPDGTKIVWTVGIEEKRLVELWIIDRLTGSHQVGWSGAEDFYTIPRQPAWSPAGDYIAFAINRYHNNEVWVLRGLL